MTGNRQSLPVPDAGVRFSPADFTRIIAAIPEDCCLVGGQAVAWWALRYGIPCLNAQGLAIAPESRDIDFWGTRAGMLEAASRMGVRAVEPHPRELTLMLGAIPLSIDGKRTVAEFLHSVPGLDTPNPDAAAMEQAYRAGKVDRKLLVLSPVSLVLAKLHALRTFDQKERQDALHLRVSLLACAPFIIEIVGAGDVKQALWNINRLVDASRFKANQRLESEQGFKILDAVPVQSLRRHAVDQRLRGRDKLAGFLSKQWPRVTR